MFRLAGMFMLRKLFFLVFILFVFSKVFCADTIPQKVTISLDSSSPFYSVELMLQKAVLGAASGSKTIVLLAGGIENLETIGIKEVNANLLLKLERAYENYIVNIYSIEKTTNILIDNSVQFKVNRLSSSINSAASSILDIIALKFPPKPVQELKKIEVVKVSLSEFELPVSSFRLKVLPLLNISRMEVGLSISNLSGGHYDCRNISSPILFSPYIELLYQYRALNALLGTGYSFGSEEGANSYCVFSDFMIGYGLFQSLIVLGVQGFFDYGTFTSSYAINTNESGTTAPPVAMPDVSFYKLLFGIYLRINITRDYFIELAGCFPKFGLESIKVHFKDENLKPPLGETVPVGEGGGPPFLKIRFTWRVWERFHLILNYSFFSSGFHSDFNESSSIKPVPLNSSLGIFLRELSVSQSLIGVGLMYEL